ncbi:MAG TPA: glycosyltransferase family 4 protein [Rhizobiaceae bacterium]|nr:glycosyltransferase family 4 protein [Rhizobiaceae bacterium]
MHLVFATSLVPDGEPATGYEIANAVILDALKRAGVRVTVLGFTWPGKQAADPENTIVLGELDVRTETASSLQKLKWLAKAVSEGLTFSSVKLRAAPLQAIRQELAKIGPFDGFVINAVQFAGAFEALFDKPSIFVAHNVEFRSAEENAAAADSAFQRSLYLREARLLKGLEARLCRKARFVFTLAEGDRVALRVEGDTRSAVLPLVTRTAPPSAPSPRAIECDAALIGTWTWQPNRIGLDWFLGAVVPYLPKSFRIRIAGRVPAGVTSDHPGVEFVGRVPDANEFVRGGAVVPLISRAGTGVQLKTIETFENGLPSVATTRSLRGIEYKPENCTVTDDPQEFAEALVRYASERVADVDGRAFHHAQIEALDRQIRKGLDALGFQAEKAYA